MAGSDVVEVMRLALKPFNIQHLADDWNANRTYLQLSVQRCQLMGLPIPEWFDPTQTRDGDGRRRTVISCPVR